MTQFDTQQIQVGISSCLLGQQVRFDGGHKRSEFVEKELTRYFSFTPVCPEMAEKPGDDPGMAFKKRRFRHQRGNRRGRSPSGPGL